MPSRPLPTRSGKIIVNIQVYRAWNVRLQIFSAPASTFPQVPAHIHQLHARVVKVCGEPFDQDERWDNRWTI